MEVKPFKAFRFDESIVGDPAGCVAPPYDVINADQQDRLYKKSQYNIVRIIKGKTAPSDSDSDNQYTRAAQYLNDWMEQGALKQDPAETIYAYIQDFQIAGRQFQRTSFVALAKLEEFGKTVRPHEQTLNGPKIDRLNLKRATSAKFGLPLCLYEDKQNIAEKIIQKTAGQKPLIDFTDQGSRHRLFPITTPDDINAIVEMMRNKCCIIADGHHRYETGLIYSKENPNPNAKYQMIAFTNTVHDGLVVLATHRLLANVEKFNAEKLFSSLRENFLITEYKFDSPQTKEDAKHKMLAQMKTEHQLDKNALGIYTADDAFSVAVLKDKNTMTSAAPDKSDAWKSLDVSVLQKLILGKLLGIDEKKLAGGTNVEYVKDTETAIDESIARVDTGEKQAAFFTNPVKIRQIESVTAAGEKMPQKSTYFYPKVYTGLTINKL